MKKACIFLAEGFEETEFVTIADLLRRAGIDVTSISIGSSTIVKGTHNISIMADCLVTEHNILGFDAYILPGGGKGTENLCKSEQLEDIIINAVVKKKIVAAICAAPFALHKFGLLKGVRCTSYPSVKDKLKDAVYLNQDVVVDRNIVTSRGVGTAIKFSLKLIELLAGQKVMREIKKQILYRGAF